MQAREDVRMLSEVQLAQLARSVMRKQAALSVRVAAVFLALLLGLPLVNRYLPGLAKAPVLGFTATWLFLAVLFYPITIWLSFYFVKRSDRIEDECRDWRAFLAESGEEGGPRPAGGEKAE